MLPLLHHWLLALMVASARAADDSSLEFELNNGNKFPAVGLGIGNMQRDRIPSVLGTAMLQHGVRLGVIGERGMTPSTRLLPHRCNWSIRPWPRTPTPPCGTRAASMS